MSVDNFWAWCQELFKGFSEASEWVMTPYDLGFAKIAPIMLFTFAGLLLFLGTAVVKWIVS